MGTFSCCLRCGSPDMRMGTISDGLARGSETLKWVCHDCDWQGTPLEFATAESLAAFRARVRSAAPRLPMVVDSQSSLRPGFVGGVLVAAGALLLAGGLIILIGSIPGGDYFVMASGLVASAFGVALFVGGIRRGRGRASPAS